MGLLGFPGVGWLFAGFPVTAIVLLTRRPRARLGGDPARVLAVRRGPAARSRLEGRVRVAAAERAAVRGDALPRAPAAADPRSRAAPPRARRRRRRRHRARARDRGGVGVIALVLVALPLVPAVSGLGEQDAPLHVRRRASPRRSRGQFLSTPRGHVKLFAWRDPQNPYPADALRVHAARRRAACWSARRRWTARAPTSCSTSIAAAAVPLAVRAALAHLARAGAARGRCARAAT